MKIVVLCNGPIALPSIELLMEEKYLAGIAVPLLLEKFPFQMQELTANHRIPLLMIHGSNPNEALEPWIREISPDIVFVMLWPFKIAANLLSVPTHGFFNWHPGLLPQYRGPDPIFWQIRNREPYGGISLHKMNADFDAGPIAFECRVEISSTDTYGDHAEKLPLSAKTVTEYLLSKISSNLSDLRLIPQDERIAGYQGEPSIADRTIDWENQSAASILALTRACNLYGGAITYLRGGPVHLLRASLANEQYSAKPGTVLRTEPFLVSSRDAAIRIEQLYAADRVFTDREFCDAFALQREERFNP